MKQILLVVPLVVIAVSALLFSLLTIKSQKDEINELVTQFEDSQTEWAEARGSLLREIQNLKAEIKKLKEKGSQSSKAKDRVDYLQWRDDMVSAAKFHKWNYLKPSDPQAGRQIAELEFDASIRDKDLHNLWELIQPHFIFNYKMNDLDFMNFNDSYFADHWMTNFIGVDRTGYPYRLQGLQRLWLENTKISDNALKVLYQPMPYLQPKAPPMQANLASMYSMTNLLEINVYGCKKVTKQGIVDLKKAFPHIKVISTFDPNPKTVEKNGSQLVD